MYIKKVAICMFSHATGKAELYLLDHKKTAKKPLFKYQPKFYGLNRITPRP